LNLKYSCDIFTLGRIFWRNTDEKWFLRAVNNVVENRSELGWNAVEKIFFLWILTDSNEVTDNSKLLQLIPDHSVWKVTDENGRFYCN